MAISSYRAMRRKLDEQRREPQEMPWHEMFGCFKRPKPLSGVYFVKCGEFIKIGRSGNVVARWTKPVTDSPYTIETLGYIPEASARRRSYLEMTLHDRFAALRARGEWFRAERDLLEFITAKGRPWPVT